MSHINNDNLLDVAVEAAIAASNIIMGDLDNPRTANHKDTVNNLITITDKKSEKLIKKIINASYPDHGILAEESSENSIKSDYLWIVDPLDGTTNFVHGYPSFAVSIALYYQNHPQIAVVLEMPNKKLYSAISNKGAWCEGEPISCSKTSTLQDSLLLTGFGYNHGQKWERNMKLFKEFTSKTHGVRRLGAAAVDLCHVASGKVDGFWEFDLQPWDTAAGILIAKEAGCIISNLDGSNYSIFNDNIIVANPTIIKDMISVINSIT